MKRKAYISPSTRIVKIRTTAILMGSDVQNTYHNDHGHVTMGSGSLDASMGESKERDASDCSSNPDPLW